MKFTTTFFALFIFLFSNVQGATITPITNMIEAKASLENVDQGTLVIFDVDRTLVMMKDQLLNGGKSAFKKKIKTYPAYTQLTKSEQETLLSIVLLKAPLQIIEQDAIGYIDQLQSKNIKTIFCTTLETGPFGLIPSIEQWRMDTLDQLGLNFRGAFPELSYIKFYPQMENSPIFKEGALITAKRTKGEVLKLFLETIDWKPKKIIMLDDKLSEIESVVEELKDSSIEFLGFHYNYISEWVNNQNLDEELVDFQLRYLIENRIWLTDEEGLVHCKV